MCLLQERTTFVQVIAFQISQLKIIIFPLNVKVFLGFNWHTLIEVCRKRKTLLINSVSFCNNKDNVLSSQFFYSSRKTYIADHKKSLRHYYNMVEKHLYFTKFSFFYFLLLCPLMASPTSLDTCKGILDWNLFYPEILSSHLSFSGFFSLCVNATWLKQFLLNLRWIEIFNWIIVYVREKQVF